MGKRILLSLAVAVVLAVSPGFSHAALADKEHSQNFTATIFLQQQIVVNKHIEGNRWRTIKEEFTGNVTSSSWPAIAGAKVKMNGTTDYTMDPGVIPGTFIIKGTTIQTMEIITGTGALTLRGKGRIEGIVPFGAIINMEWESSSGTGSMKKVELESKMNANFTWLTLPPSGTAAMTGKYKLDD